MHHIPGSAHQHIPHPSLLMCLHSIISFYVIVFNKFYLAYVYLQHEFVWLCCKQLHRLDRQTETLLILREIQGIQ